MKEIEQIVDLVSQEFPDVTATAQNESVSLYRHGNIVQISWNGESFAIDSDGTGMLDVNDDGTTFLMSKIIGTPEDAAKSAIRRLRTFADNPKRDDIIILCEELSGMVRRVEQEKPSPEDAHYWWGVIDNYYRQLKRAMWNGEQGTIEDRLDNIEARLPKWPGTVRYGKK